MCVVVVVNVSWWFFVRRIVLYAVGAGTCLSWVIAGSSGGGQCVIWVGFVFWDLGGYVWFFVVHFVIAVVTVVFSLVPRGDGRVAVLRYGFYLGGYVFGWCFLCEPIVGKATAFHA